MSEPRNRTPALAAALFLVVVVVVASVAALRSGSSTSAGELVPSTTMSPSPTSAAAPTAPAATSATPAPTAAGATAAPTAAAPTEAAVPTAAAPSSYYVDDLAGSDASDGRSPQTAWRTLQFAGGRLRAGDSLLLRRGGEWTDGLEITGSGTAENPIAVGAFGAGPLPVIRSGDCVRLDGDYIVVRELMISGCSWSGVRVTGSNDRIEDSTITGNVAGVYVTSSAFGTKVIGNRIIDNNVMSVNDRGGKGDSGAFGVLVHGASTEIAYNLIAGSDAFSYDYGRDGAAIEIYRGQDTHVHHNVASGNDAFAEIGEPEAVDNRFDDNVVTSSLVSSVFIVVRGAESSRGPNLGTVVEHNSVLFTGASSQGFVCHAGCTAGVLTLRNNIIDVAGKVGYADGPFVSATNIFWHGELDFTPGADDLVVDPGWVGAGASDLHLTASSPAIGAASALGYGTDADGKKRDAVAPDIGAYEY